jgi:hypothetical protein
MDSSAKNILNNIAVVVLALLLTLVAVGGMLVK